MQVAELFISLGVKGQDKAVTALVSVEHGLKGLASTSLEAKAAIIGAMYAVEQLFQRSGAQGTNLTNLNAVLGVSTKTLQQYDYAARQVGVSNAETEASFKALQQAATKTVLGQGAPKGLAQVAMLTGGISAQDMQKYMQAPELLHQRLQEYANKEKRVGIRNEVLSSFGLGDNMIAALSRNAFRPDVLKRAPIYSDNEIKSLDKANIAWSNLGNTIEMAVGHLNAAHGGEIVKDFQILVNIGLKAADMLLKFTERFHLFRAFDNIFKDVTKGAEGVLGLIEKLSTGVTNFSQKNHIFETLASDFDRIEGSVSSLIPYFARVGEAIAKVAKDGDLFSHLGTISKGTIDDITKFTNALEHAFETFSKFDSKFEVLQKTAIVLQIALQGLELWLKGIGIALDTIVGDVDTLGVYMGKKPSEETRIDIAKTFSPEAGLTGEEILEHLKSIPELQKKSASANTQTNSNIPPAPAGNTTSSSTTQNITVNQTLNFSHGDKNSGDTSSAVKKAVNDAFRQLNSQKQGS